MRDSEQGFIQKVIRDFAEYFNCGAAWCGNEVRASMHEVYVSGSQVGLVGMPIAF